MLLLVEETQAADAEAMWLCSVTLAETKQN